METVESDSEDSDASWEPSPYTTSESNTSDDSCTSSSEDSENDVDAVLPLSLRKSPRRMFFSDQETGIHKDGIANIF